MSIYLKSQALGIDVVVNELQLAISRELNWINYDAFHRIYKNTSINGTIPEAYKVISQGKVGEYVNVLLNDNIAASSFFYTGDIRSTVDNGNLTSITLSIIFQVNIVDITGVENVRLDEEIHNLIIRAINNNSVYGKVSSLVTGIPSVYTDFDIGEINLDDMQPFHCFRVDIDVSFEQNCKVFSERYFSDINGNPVTYIGTPPEPGPQPSGFTYTLPFLLS